MNHVHSSGFPPFMDHYLTRILYMWYSKRIYKPLSLVCTSKNQNGFEAPAMTSEVASGSDQPPPHTQEQASGTDVCFSTSIQVETSRIDLCMAEEIAAYEDDFAFIEKQTEAKRRKNANHRINLRFRTWEAWERVHMVREDQNTWLQVPQDGGSSASTAAAVVNPPAVNSLREHILRIAAKCQQQSEQQQQGNSRPSTFHCPGRQKL